MPRRTPAEQARRGRCGAINLDGEPCVCFRWRGHAGPHRGARAGQFYGVARAQWDNEVDTNDGPAENDDWTAPIAENH